MATDPNAQIYDAIRKADAAGDADSVTRLSQYLKQAQPAPITDSGTTTGFLDEAPPEATHQLSPEDTATFYKMLRGDGRAKATAADLRAFVGGKGLSLDNAEDIVSARDAGNGVVGQITYPLPKVQPTDGAAGSLGRGVADTLTFGALPKIGAAIAGTESAVRGNGFTDAYHATLDQNNGVVASDQEEHPYYRIAGQLLGGIAIPSGLEGVGYQAGASALRSGASMQEARAIAATAVKNRLALTGGALGAAHGALSADNLPDAAKGALTEGALGATAGLALGTAGQILDPAIQASRVAARSAGLTDGQRVAGAAARQGVDVLPADVGGPATRIMTATATKTPFGAGPVVAAAQNAVEQSQGVRDRVAQSVGAVLNPEAAGETAAQAARGYITRSSAQGNAMYRAAENAAAGARVTPTRALAALDQNINELAQTPGGADGLQRLQGLRDALSNGQFSVGGIRNMRTALRDQFANDGLRGSDIERRVNQVVDAANEDVIDSLNGVGRGAAARLYGNADQFWRGRVQTIDNVIQPLIGTDAAPKSGEEVVKGLQRAMAGNNDRFTRFLDVLAPQEEQDVRASLIGRLGHATAGNQNDAGNAFSLQTFLSNWNNIGERAKNRLFGAEGRSALDDLATIANGARQTQRLANHSNTGAVTEGGRLLTYILTPLTGGAVVGGQYALGRLLASPRFTRWLARAPSSSLGAGAYIERLSRIARAEPAIANDTLALQQRLSSAFTGSRPLAAQQEGDGSQPVQPQK